MGVVIGSIAVVVIVIAFTLAWLDKTLKRKGKEQTEARRLLPTLRAIQRRKNRRQG